MTKNVGVKPNDYFMCVLKNIKPMQEKETQLNRKWLNVHGATVIILNLRKLGIFTVNHIT